VRALARILICEPHAEVRELLGHVVVRLGHEPVHGLPPAPHGDEVDAVLLEPAHAPSREAVAALCLSRPGLPVVCTSIHPPGGDEDDLEPFAYLLKPFALEDLENAIERALASRLSAV
jgi:CheY-like chemotaxis protein